MNLEVGLRQTEEDTEGEENRIQYHDSLYSVQRQVPAPLEHFAAWVLPD